MSSTYRYLHTCIQNDLARRTPTQKDAHLTGTKRIDIGVIKCSLRASYGKSPATDMIDCIISTFLGVLNGNCEDRAKIHEGEN